MVILGGLEIIAGGYIVHRYQKNKNEKKRLEQEAQQRRHNTFPGAKSQPFNQSHPQHAIPPQKHGYVAHAPPNRSQSSYPPPHRPYTEPPPHRLHNAPHASQPQTFMIPRRPLPKQHHAPPPPQIIQPLQRADSMATISRMPIANGYRPSNLLDDPQLPPRRQNSQLSPIPQSPMAPPYGHPGFAVSSPALVNYPTTTTHSPIQYGGRQTVDDNWETFNQAPGHGHYASTVSTALGEARDDDPPPPYRP
ncbi:uncharacterized protein N0V89_008721 [Didymosphaeria variabile]|uniref:Uncharacterized protein n=1 Tax=Didymosphaeria variabile TaxID=1932322 RepID=A0A9W8XGG5_9PLEO|nr:uncharacterized protein N0V89_008721 [Didymosphaeria variabile]KAJ4350100.1 hypothetical protein N0V89_008721 [Didymosphaeria variabile]